MENATINSNGAGDDETEVQSVEQAPDAFTQLIEKRSVSKFVEIWPDMLASLERHGLSGTLDPSDRTVKVWTTASATEPNIIYKAWGCILLVAQAACSPSAAIEELDGRHYYDHINIGYQEGGLAAVHRIDEEVYMKKRQCVYKHLQALADACYCGMQIREGRDGITVCGRGLERIRKFRTAVERCFLEDIDLEEQAKELYAEHRRNRRMMKTVKTMQDLTMEDQ